jgi:hypothetical protein
LSEDRHTLTLQRHAVTVKLTNKHSWRHERAFFGLYNRATGLAVRVAVVLLGQRRSLSRLSGCVVRNPAAVP